MSKGSLKYRALHKKLGLCVSCPNLPKTGTFYCEACATKRSKKAKVRNQDLKRQVIAHYGGQCVWTDCGITDLDLLTVDHVNNDGAAERDAQTRTYAGGNGAFYRHVIANGFPDSLQILCWNHQWKKRMMFLRGELTQKATV